MVRVRSRRENVAFTARARFIAVGALGALLLLGALAPTAAGASSSEAGQSHEHSSYVVQHEATVSANASNAARSHRLALPGAYLVVTCLAAIAARRMACGDRRTSRRRLEQFNVLQRGPPHLLFVTH